MSGLTLRKEPGLVHLTVPMPWSNGTVREKTVTFSEGNLPVVVAALEAFLGNDATATGETIAFGDTLTTRVGGNDAAPSLIVQNRRDEASAGTVWLSEDQAREFLAMPR